jgi:hypothetical protein
LHILGVSHETATGAPFGWDQGNGVNVQRLWYIFPAFLAAKVIGEIAAYNLIVLTGLALSGAAMYWLVRSLVVGPVSPFVAAWAGFVYVVFPWHVIKAAGHAGLTHIEGFPLLLLAVLAWFRSPTLTRATLIALATAVLWLTSGYYGVAGMVALCVLLLVAAVSHRRQFGTRWAAAKAGVVLGEALLVALVISVLGRLGHIETGFFMARSKDALLDFGARPGLLRRTQVRISIQRLAHGPSPRTTSPELALCRLVDDPAAAGWLLWALAARQRLGREQNSWASGSAGLPPLSFSRSRARSRTPQFRHRRSWSGSREPVSRANPIPGAVMAALVLAALALAGISKKALAASRSWAAVVAVFVVFGLISWYELSVAAGLTALNAPPPEYLALGRHHPGSSPSIPLSLSMLPAIPTTCSGVGSVAGASQRRLARELPDTVRDALVDTVAPGTPAALSMLGVSTILLHPDVYTGMGLAKQAPADLGPGYRRTTPMHEHVESRRSFACPRHLRAGLRAFRAHGPGTITLAPPEGWDDRPVRTQGLTVSGTDPRELQCPADNRLDRRRSTLSTPPGTA